MQVSVEKLGGLKRRIRVEVPSALVEARIEERLRSAGRETRLKGFRPGKVPAAIVRQRHGAEVRRQVLQEFLQQVCRDAIREAGLEAVGNANVEQEAHAPAGTLVLTATFEVYPEFDVRGLDALEVERPVVTVTDADVDELIARLARQREAALGRPPSLDDDFARSFGIGNGGMAALRAAAAADMTCEAAIETRDEVRMQLLAQLAAATAVELPEILIEQETARLGREHADVARRNVSMGLVARRIFQQQKLRVLREDVNARIAALCKPGESVEEKHNWYADHRDELAAIEHAVIDDKVLAWLEERARFTDRPMSFVELMDLRRRRWGKPS